MKCVINLLTSVLVRLVHIPWFLSHYHCNRSSTVIARHVRDGILDLLPDHTRYNYLLEDLLVIKGSDTELQNVSHVHNLQNVLVTNRGHGYDLF